MENGTIDINLKFRASREVDCGAADVEFSHESFNDLIYSNDNVHECLKSLLKSAMNVETKEVDDATVQVTVHRSESRDEDESNPKRIPSLKSCHSMENLLKQKKADFGKVKATSVDNMLDQNESECEFIENGESIELIFISDEFVNKAQKSDTEVIVLDRENDKRRDSLINKKKIVIITDEYKDKVLRNNSIKITNNNNSNNKSSTLIKTNTKRVSKTYSTSFCEDEPIQDLENKKI